MTEATLADVARMRLLSQRLLDPLPTPTDAVRLSPAMSMGPF